MENVNWRIRLDVWFGWLLHVLLRGRLDLKIHDWFNRKYAEVEIVCNCDDSWHNGCQDRKNCGCVHTPGEMEAWRREIHEFIDYENNNNNQKEKAMTTIKYYDHSTLDDLPDIAVYMSEAETLGIFIWPEPEHEQDIDGMTVTYASWYAQMYIKSSRGWHRDYGRDWCIGADR